MRKFDYESDLRVFTNTKALVFAAVMVALSVVGKILRIDIGDSVRFSFEAMPIIMSGMALGPFAGCLVGVAADLTGCLVSGFSPIPLITVAMGFLGIVSGFTPYLFKDKFGIASIMIAEVAAHLVSSVFLKTIALAITYGAENGIFQLFAMRFIQFLLVVTLEISLLILICENAYIKRELKGLKK